MLGGLIGIAILVAADIVVSANTAAALKRSVSSQMHRNRAAILQGMAEEMVARTERVDERLSDLERRVSNAETKK